MVVEVSPEVLGIYLPYRAWALYSDIPMLRALKVHSSNYGIVEDVIIKECFLRVFDFYSTRWSSFM